MYIYGLKKTQIIYLKSQIFLLFRSFINVFNKYNTLIKLLKRREIFVILNKLCVFLIHIFQVTHIYIYDHV